MDIIVYEFIRLPQDKVSKKNKDYIFDGHIIMYFWNTFDKFKEEGIIKYGTCITISEIKKLIGGENFKLFKDGENIFHVFKY